MIRQLRSPLHCMDGLCFSECIQFVEYVVKPSLYNVNFLDSARAPWSRVSATSGSSQSPSCTTPYSIYIRRHRPRRKVDHHGGAVRAVLLTQDEQIDGRKLLVYNKPEFIGINEKLYSRVAQDRINAAASAAAASTAASICSSSCRIVIKRRRRQNADHHRRLFSQLCQHLLKTRTALGGWNDNCLGQKRSLKS